MLIILDLDSTILDTKSFRLALANALQVPLDDFNRTSRETFHNKGKNYDFYEHVAVMKASGLIPDKDKELMAQANTVIDDIDDFLFTEAVELMSLLEKNRESMVLITRGNKAWQGLKVDKLKIKDKFDQIIITEKLKSEELGFLDGYKGEVVIINDRPYETITMAAAVKQPVRHFIIKSKHSYTLPPDELSYELKDVIEELYGDKQTSNR